MPCDASTSEERALARGEAAGHLVAEVDVAGRVDQVEDVVLPREAHVLGLDRDAPLAFEVHGVEVLRPHVTGVDGAGELEDAVGQGALPVVDVRDDREGTEALERRHPPILVVARLRPRTGSPASLAWFQSEFGSSFTRHGEHQESDEAQPLRTSAAGSGTWPRGPS